jgi:CTP:molybdopterin cytidylyltransferase MocA
MATEPGAARGTRRRDLLRAVEAALRSACRPVVVVLSPRDVTLRDEIAAINDPARLKVALNWALHEGISASIRQGLAALSASPVRVDAAVFIRAGAASTGHAIRELMAAREACHAPVVASRSGSGAGLPALFCASMFDELLQLHGDQGLLDIIGRHAKQPIDIGGRRDLAAFG